jgi:hypothetical protein
VVDHSDKIVVPRPFPPPALLLVGLLLITGCEPPKPAGDPWEHAGFLRHVPGNSEGFLALRQPGPRWRELAPAWDALLAQPAIRTAGERSPAGQILTAFLAEPKTSALTAALGSAAEEEMFIVLGPGTAAQLSSLQQIKRIFEAARVRSLFTPPLPDGLAESDEPPPELLPENPATAAFSEVRVPLPPSMESALQHFVKNATVPPILIGMKTADGPGTVPGVLEAWAQNLPEKFPRDTVNVPPHGNFTRVRLPVSQLVPREAAVRARDLLAATIGDPYSATYIVRDLLAKPTVVSFGRAHGYFVVSVGTENLVELLAAGLEGSLASNPAIAPLAPLSGPETAVLFYADALVTGLAASPPPVGEYLDAALESALEFAPAGRIQPLREAAAPLRDQAAKLFQPRVAATAGIIRCENDRWRAEIFGGSFAPRLAKENATPLVPADARLAMLWTEHWEPDYAKQLLKFTAGAAAFSTQWLDTLGPVFLSPDRLSRDRALLAAIQGPATQINLVGTRLLDQALGRDVALAVGLDDRLPSVAMAASLRDRDAVGKLWEEMVASQTPRWPQPTAQSLPDGGASYEFPLPLVGPGLGLAVTIQNNRWILGSSGPLTRLLGATPAAATDQACVQSLHLETKPLADFARTWAAALRADPSLTTRAGEFLPSNPDTLEAAAAILATPRRFHYSARWEEQNLHRTLELAPSP